MTFCKVPTWSKSVGFVLYMIHELSRSVFPESLLAVLWDLEKCNCGYDSTGPLTVMSSAESKSFSESSRST